MPSDSPFGAVVARYDLTTGALVTRFGRDGISRLAGSGLQTVQDLVLRAGAPDLAYVSGHASLDLRVARVWNHVPR